jgi:hypothetical protein
MRSLCCVIVLTACLLAACGSEETCEIKDPGELPAEGEYIDPYAMPLPRDCIEGGLTKLPGRWFVADATKIFSFAYPRFEGDCKTGLRQSFGMPEDHDITDGTSFYTWSDGTRFFQRREVRYPLPDKTTYVYVTAQVYCAMPGDKLAAASITHSGPNDPVMTTSTGKRFARKDSLADGIELVGELGATSAGGSIEGLNLVIDGSHAYVAGITGFDIVDVADPAHPVATAHIDGNYNDVKVTHAAGKTFAILADRSGTDETEIVDVTNPHAIVPASTIKAYSHSLQLQQRGATTELYLADYTGYVPRYDITDPYAPRLLDMARVPGPEGAVHDVTIDGDRIYANNTTGGFVAFDTSTSRIEPVMLGHTDAPYSHASWVGTAGGRAIMLHGDEGMTKTRDGGAYLRVLDGTIGAPTFMADIGRYQTRPEVGIHNFEVHGDLAYIAYYQDGVRIVDLSDPTKPREVAHYNTWDPETAPGGAFEGALGIRKVGDLIYVADDVRGLLILRETR